MAYILCPDFRKAFVTEQRNIRSSFPYIWCNIIVSVLHANLFPSNSSSYSSSFSTLCIYHQLLPQIHLLSTSKLGLFEIICWTADKFPISQVLGIYYWFIEHMDVQFCVCSCIYLLLPAQSDVYISPTQITGCLWAPCPASRFTNAVLFSSWFPFSEF